MEKSDNSISTFVGPSSEITDHEIEEFKSKLDKMIKNCSVVVLSGSSPCESANGIFPYALELANHYDKISILDTYGEHLKDCLETTPTAMHNNLEEIDGSLGIELKSEKEKLEFLDYLYGKNIKLSFLTDGANPGYAAKFDFHYKVESPEIKALDPTGSGDAFVAGIAYGLEKSLVFDEFLRIASALGTANAVNRDTCSVKDNEWKKYYDSITISPIGKKMKTIDDSPNY
jgi:fructose-1-phosphate kinase PfkB-like protein